jgi:hypothetical protein
LGFEDPVYGDLREGERGYKSQHSDLYVQELGDGRGEELLRTNNIGELVRRAYRLFSINLLHAQEQIKVREALRDEKNAAEFFRCLFALVQAPGVDRLFFERYVESVEASRTTRISGSQPGR